MDYKEIDIDELLENADIVKIISKDTELRPFESHYIGKCPFEESDNESFIVDPEKNIYFCLNCGFGGNIIDYIMKKDNIDFHNAIRILSANTGTFIFKNKNGNLNSVKNRALLHSIYVIAMNHYIELLNSDNNPGLEYIKNREITEKMQKDFKLGYSGNFGDDLYKKLVKKGFSNEDILKSGIIGEKKENGKSYYYDKFYNRLMFPIFNKNGYLIGFGGRTLTNNTAKYINSQETVLFDKGSNLYGMQIASRTKSKYFIVCEGNVDVIMLHQFGYNNAVASLGTALTRDHVELLLSYDKEIYLVYDSDDAGKKATNKAIKLFEEYGVYPRIIDLSPYKDPDEFLKNLGKEEFDNRIKNASTCDEFRINYIKASFSEEDKDEYYNLIFNHIKTKI